MNPKPRIYISAPVDGNLRQNQIDMKHAILSVIKSQGFEPQEFGVSGLPKRDGWSFDAADRVCRRCHGAVIMAFAQWTAGAFAQWTAAGITPTLVMPSEYNHFEGAVALTRNVATLIIKDEVVAPRGITYYGGGSFVVDIPTGSGLVWLQSPGFRSHFQDWVDSILKQRHDVFFGYCGRATNTANAIIAYLGSLNVAVRNWRTDFRPGGTILDEIETASKSCIGGVFLFTKDDDLISGDQAHAAPRDNVLFEAGYFMHAMGRERTLIIREEGTKMPADIGGNIYLHLSDRNDISTIESGLRRFIDTRL